MLHDRHRRQEAGSTGASVFGGQVGFGEVVHDVDGLSGGEQRGAGAVAEEAQVAVVGHDVDGGVPGDLGGGRGAGADVVDGADVAAIEAEARAGAEHGFVGWVGGG